MMNRFVGNFDIETGKVIVSDPCYDKGIWCTGTLDYVKKGTWEAIIVVNEMKDTIFKHLEYDERACELITTHVNHNNDILNWVQTDIHVGVDSGQAGIYDEKYYKDDSIFNNEEALYNNMMDIGYDAKNDIKFDEDRIEEYNTKLKDESISDEEKKNYENMIHWCDISIKNRSKKIGKVCVHENNWCSDSRELWYSHNCAKTSGVVNPPNYHRGTYYDKLEIVKLHGGVIPYGVVSSSGWGDGGYNCYIAMNHQNEIIAIKIKFIKDDEL